MKPYFITFILLFFISIESKGQTAVQSNGLYTTTTAASISVTFTSNNTATNLIVVHVDWGDNTKTVTGVTDNNGNVYNRIANTHITWNTSWSGELWYTYNIKVTPNAKITVKATFSATPAVHMQLYINEYSGMLTTSAPLDQSNANFGTALSVTTGSVTTTLANELIYAVGIGGGAGTITVGSGFTSNSTYAVSESNIVESQTLVNAGTVNAPFNNSATSPWLAQIATFQTSISPLPIGLVDFTAQCNANNVVINWTTASEIDNNYFTIERSKDAFEFNSIGTIKGAGNSSDNINYSFTDTNPFAGEGYYRLKQTDYNGNSTTFNIVVTDCEPNVAPVFLHYNNQAGTITIDINSDMSAEYISCIYDEQGRRVSAQQFYHDKENRDYSIDVSSLRAGIYFMSLESAGNRTTQKFLIR